MGDRGEGAYGGDGDQAGAVGLTMDIPTAMSQDDAIGRLARQIDAARKSEHFLVNPEEIAGLRQQGACQLYQICCDFVSSVNRKVSQSRLDLSPPAYGPEMFRDPGVNLIQISSQGRQIQVMFQATTQLFSTEKYAVPYVLEGELRSYNQTMLEQFEIRNQSLFYCVEGETAGWRFFDWRNPRTVLLDADLLARIMQRLF